MYNNVSLKSMTALNAHGRRRPFPDVMISQTLRQCEQCCGNWYVF